MSQQINQTSWWAPSLPLPASRHGLLGDGLGDGPWRWLTITPTSANDRSLSHLRQCWHMSPSEPSQPSPSLLGASGV